MLNIDMLKYLVVGSANTIFTFFIFYILINTFNTHYIFALTIAAASGLLLTYVFNFIWTFQPEKKLNFQKRFFRYCIVYFFSYLCNIVLLDIVVKKMEYDPFFSQFFIMPIMIVLNYIGIKFWALKQNTLVKGI